MRQIKQGEKSWFQYATDTFPGGNIGYDPRLLPGFSVDNVKFVFQTNNTKLVPITHNIVEEVWGANRPAQSLNPIFIHDEKYCGMPTYEKIVCIGYQLEALGQSHILAC